jgi:hypothetical protein
MYTLFTTEFDQVSKLMIIIGLLIIVIIGGLIYFLIYKKMQRKAPSDTMHAEYIKDVPDSIGYNGTYNYRTITSLTSIKDCEGVLYSPTEIMDYLNGPYAQIIQRQEAFKPLPPGYEWRVGFYWFVRDVLGKKQLGYYVIPTAFNPTTDVVLNYFNDSFYYHPGSGVFTSIKDEGHLWP